MKKDIEVRYFKADYLNKYIKRGNSDDIILLTDFQYWCDGVWFVRGTYPTESEFKWFKGLSLNQRYKLIN